ncbi:uncharacterized protein LY89DRAFT_668588 [Mollisia scopiformis]|uniref:Uncharacterized protein n=1 Tax=Mollisia scopiformis TaxID=149040 RepID=A0A194XE73_MOLSC|nr:uncharacterized protein LY89DRAFT_668588 [Mollisia scopiformis]KUJ18444.1 hypothetical protein LY89DRAFT_668588 [Mollisia scopiformis]
MDTHIEVAARDPNSRLLIGSRDKDVAWYKPNLISLTEPQRDLFENYSHVAPDQVIPHILKVFNQRDKAWDFLPLPCVGMFRFIDFELSMSPLYSDILSRLKAENKLLDLGCCFGQDMRKLVHDGAPPSSIFGAELRKEYVDSGYDLFLDRDTFGVKIIMADVFDTHGPLNELEDQMDMIHVGLFLHLFDWEGQRKACERMVSLLKKQEGVMVLGHQLGNLQPKDVPFGAAQKVFRHDEQTFERLWMEVGENTGSTWDVKVTLDRGMGIAENKRPWDDENTRKMTFEVVRIK